jgi:uncharacterized protein (TIRG00374 family)
VSDGGEPVPAAKRKWSAIAKRVQPYARVVLALVAVGLTAWVLSGHLAELEGASAYLTHIRWVWLIPAVAAEVGSFVAFALVQQELLSAGQLRVSLRWLTAVTIANIAITDSLPTGSVVATIFTYRQYRRRGADEVLAGWAIIALLVVTSVTLAVIAATGVGIAGSESSSFDLVGVTIGILLLTLVLGGLFVQRRILLWGLSKVSKLLTTLMPRSRLKPDALLEHLIERLAAVHLPLKRAIAPVIWGFANWVLDCGCLVLSFAALGVGVPWRGLLLAYGAGQLAANLPITPGGLGVVEGSLVIALVAYGGAETSTVAAVFLYRLMSFWGELPFGWVAWAWLARSHRRAAMADGPVAMDSEVKDPEEVCAR